MLGFQEHQHLPRVVVVHHFALQEAHIAVTRLARHRRAAQAIRRADVDR
jgi:hypothetical protein